MRRNINTPTEERLPPFYNFTNAHFPTWSGFYYKKIDRYVPRIFLLTLLYLVVELAFNARLLDVVGGQATMEEIDAIEIYGRIISGVALGLALLGSVIMPFFHRRLLNRERSYPVICVLTMLLSLGVMYKFQEVLVDYIVDSSTEDERHAAVRLRLLTDAVHDGKVEIENIELDGEALLSPEGKSFMALLPVMAFSISDLKERTDDAMRQVVRNLIIKEVGDPITLYNEAYVPAVEELYERYAEYVKGSNKYSEAIASIPTEQRNAWLAYERRLKAFGYTPNSVPRSLDNRFRYEVRKQGVNVPDNWRANDSRGFYAAIERQIRDEADQRYRQEMYRIPQFRGSYPQPGLSFRDFTLFAPIQRELLRGMKVDKIPGIRILPDYAWEQYRDAVWERVISHYVAEKMDMLSSDLVEFRDGGAYEEEGRLAMKALAVPPIALFISLIGAMVHVFKASNYGLRIIWPEARWRAPLLAVICLVLVWLPVNGTNHITAAPLYESFKANTSERFGPVVSGALTWIIQAQPYAYPVNNFVREYPLLGFTFGYADRD